jgi:hypothetical protein
MQPSIDFTNAKTEFKNRPVFYDDDIIEDTHIVNKEYVDTENVKTTEYHAYKVVSPDLFDENDKGTMTYVSNAYLSGAPFDVSPGIYAVSFANKDINDKDSHNFSPGDTFDLLTKDASGKEGIAQFMIGRTRPGPHGIRVKKTDASHSGAIFKEGTYVYFRTPGASTYVTDIHQTNTVKPTSEIFQVKVGSETDVRPTSPNTINYIYNNNPDTGDVDSTSILLTDDDYEKLTEDIKISQRNFLYIDRGFGLVTIDYVNNMNSSLHILGDLRAFLSSNEGNMITMTFDTDDRVVRNEEFTSAFDFSSYPELT